MKCLKMFLQLEVNASETSSQCCKRPDSFSLSQLCTGPCVFPGRWEICCFFERCPDVGKGESILTFRNWNTTQSILTEDFFFSVISSFCKKEIWGIYNPHFGCSRIILWEVGW